MLAREVAAVAQAATFDDLFPMMRRPLKPDSEGGVKVVRRLLRELERDGYIVERDGLYKLTDDIDPELSHALSWFTDDVPDPAAKPYRGIAVPAKLLG